jgi:hypothetical protein
MALLTLELRSRKIGSSLGVAKALGFTPPLAALRLFFGMLPASNKNAEEHKNAAPKQEQPAIQPLPRDFCQLPLTEWWGGHL